MNHLVMFFLSILAFACLALTMERHQADFFGRRLRADHARVLWIAGWTLLCGSLVFALRQPAWSIGLVAWFGWLSAGAAAVFATLASAALRVASSSRRMPLCGRSK